VQDSRDVCQIDAGLIITRIGEPDLDLTLSCNNFFYFPPSTEGRTVLDISFLYLENAPCARYKTRLRSQILFPLSIPDFSFFSFFSFSHNYTNALNTRQAVYHVDNVEHHFQDSPRYVVEAPRRHSMFVADDRVVSCRLLGSSRGSLFATSSKDVD